MDKAIELINNVSQEEFDELEETKNLKDKDYSKVKYEDDFFEVELAK